MKTIPIDVGRIVSSKAGRDRGRLFAVVQVLDEQFVLVSDGKFRTLDRPKKKRKKHLKPTPAIVEPLEKGEPIQDHDLRRWICKEEGKLVQV